MELDGQHVGYTAFELCKYLHPLIAEDVVDVYCQCIKYRVDFFKIGFYPRVDFLFFLKEGWKHF